MVHVRSGEGDSRSFADVEVTNLLTKEASPDVSVALATVRGTHPPTRSNRCTRVYYFISGEAQVDVGSNSYAASAGDVVLVPRGEEHGLRGIASYVVINTPAFDPALE